jgi:2-hydroxy-3-keto-5-methylthiopentenyl-1-phosphate phosphatase
MAVVNDNRLPSPSPSLGRFSSAMTNILSSSAPASAPTIVQCDFDGTVTLEDASFIVLDSFAQGDWRAINRKYEAGKMTVGRFNDEAFALVKATRRQMLDSIRGKVNVRPGFKEFIAHCRAHDIRVVIVSNGLELYIDDILKSLGLGDIEFHAAETRFDGPKVSVRYVGPDGMRVEDSYKCVFVNHFLGQGYRVLYVGDGSSDFAPAQKCQAVFARATLLERCASAGVSHLPFETFDDITASLNGKAC